MVGLSIKKFTVVTQVILYFIFVSHIQGQHTYIPYKKGDSVTITLLALEGVPGLTTAFGHTQFRVINHTWHRDDVIDFAGRANWEVISYMKEFFFGNLYYDIYSFPTTDVYKKNRTVDELFLKLTSKQKEQLMTILSGAFFMEEGGQYKYDYIYRNCSTLVRDVLEDVYGDLEYPKLDQDNKTFREIYRDGLKYNPWIKFFSDMILGPFSDRVATPREQMFIPVILYKYIRGAKVNGALIAEKHRILTSGKAPKPLGILEYPTVWVWFLFFLELVLAFIWIRQSNWRKWVTVYDRIWFFFAATMSVLIIALWTVSNYDYAARDNWNLLWLNPLYILLFFMPLNRSWRISKVVSGLIVLSLLVLLLGWSIIPQSFNINFLPLLLLYLVKVGKYLLPKPSASAV